MRGIFAVSEIGYPKKILPNGREIFDEILFKLLFAYDDMMW